MSIKINDVKKLWGASGGRCSICRVELSTVDNTEVLGEMAHIVARSEDGPRGDEKLPLEERDQYDNLILVCPNDHKKIDTNIDEWSVEKLHSIKGQHELWVIKQLESGKLSQKNLDGSKFVEERIRNWEQQNKHSWSIVSLTPLRIDDDVIDPLNHQFKSNINKIKLPEIYGRHINHFLTEPSANGIVNEDFRESVNDSGHRIELWRNGHFEFIICIDYLLNFSPVNPPKSDEEAKKRRAQEHWLNTPSHHIPYKYFAKIVVPQIKSSLNFWQKANTRFNDMIISACIIGIENASLFEKGEFDYIIGRPVESTTLKYSTVVDRNISEQELVDNVFIRLVNYFGFELGSVYNDQGDYNTPKGHTRFWL